MVMSISSRQLLSGVIVLLVTSVSKAEERPGDYRIVQRLTYVGCDLQVSEPPNLKIHVSGEVPWDGFTKTRLVRAHYDNAPEDGIQEFFLMVMPPKDAKAG